MLKLFIKIFLIATLLMTLPYDHANARVDSTFRFYFYDQRYDLFEYLPREPGRIVMLGNSLINSADWAEIFGNPHIINRGISGDNTFGVLNRIGQITAMQPEKVFILIGINDLARGTPVNIILSNYQKIVGSILDESPQTRIYIQSILPTNNRFIDFINHQNKDHLIREVNSGLKKLAEDRSLVFIDLYPHFLDDEGRLSEKYTNDGLHLMGSGYMLWAEILRPFIDETPQPEEPSAPFGGLYYERKRAMHESMPEVKNAIVMLGNSLTEHGHWNELFPGLTILNRGIGGDNIRGMTERLPGILRQQPEKIFIMAGINNILFRNCRILELIEGMEEMIRIIRTQSPKTRIIIQSVLPVNDDAGSGNFFSKKNSTIRDFNLQLAAVCRQQSIQFVNLFESFVDENGNLKPGLSIDGIHLSPQGYKLWASQIAAFMID
jgi:lysophospholipase L1-like esterase